MCLTKHHAMKTYWGAEVHQPHAPTSALDGDEWLLHASAALSSGKRRRYPTDRRLGTARSQSEHDGHETITGPCREWNHGRAVLSITTYPPLLINTYTKSSGGRCVCVCVSLNT
jgi:hypothetical protein